MKRLHYLASMMLCIATTSLASRDFEHQTLQLNVGPSFNYARYTLGCLPRMQGYLGGIHTDLTYNRKWYSRTQFDGHWNAGPALVGKLDTRAKVRDYTTSSLVGYNFQMEDMPNMVATPLIGLEFNYLSNKLRPDIITYRYLMVNMPIGGRLLWTIRENEFDIALHALYLANIYGKVKLKIPCLDDLDTKCDKLDLKRSHGFHVETPFTWYKSHDRRANWHFKVVPFFDWNKYGAVDEKNSNNLALGIPSLKRWHLGLRLDFGLTF